MSSSNASPATLGAPPAALAPRRPSPLARAVRWGFGALLIAVSGWLILVQEQFRSAEASVMTLILKPFLGDGVFAFRDQFVIQQDETHYLGLQITMECTTLVLIVPLLALLAVLIVVLRGLNWFRFIVGALVGAALICVINLSRIGMIAASTVLWEHTGYEWSHIVVGSIVALVGNIATLLVTLRIITGRRLRRRR